MSRIGVATQFWTPEEDQILRTHYPSMGVRVMQFLPRRTRGSTSRRASELGLRRRGVSDALRRSVQAAYSHNDLKPKGLNTCEAFSREWYERQNRAFCFAMRACPEERPPSYLFSTNSSGSTR